MHVCACCMIIHLQFRCFISIMKGDLLESDTMFPDICSFTDDAVLFMRKQPVEIDLWYTARMVRNIESDSVIKNKQTKKQWPSWYRRFLSATQYPFLPLHPEAPPFILSYPEQSAESDLFPFPLMLTQWLLFACWTFVGRWPLGSFRDRMSHIIYAYALVRLKNIGFQP